MMLRTLRLLRYDYRLLLRDPMLLLLSGMSPVLALTFRLAREDIARAAGADAALVTTIGVVVLVMMSPLLFGLVAGLMLLEERDEGVLTAIDLTPLGRTRFVTLRLLPAVLYSTCAAAFVLLLFPRPQPLAIALLAGLQAPLFALFLGAFAANRIEGMALSKVGNVIVFIGAIAVLAPPPWQVLAWWSPHYWLTRSLAAPLGLTTLAAGLLAHAVAIGGLARLYERRQR